jgi:hypothetical protein
VTFNTFNGSIAFKCRIFRTTFALCLLFAVRLFAFRRPFLSASALCRESLFRSLAVELVAQNGIWRLLRGRGHMTDSSLDWIWMSARPLVRRLTTTISPLSGRRGGTRRAHAACSISLNKSICMSQRAKRAERCTCTLGGNGTGTGAALVSGWGAACLLPPGFCLRWPWCAWGLRPAWGLGAHMQHMHTCHDFAPGTPLLHYSTGPQGRRVVAMAGGGGDVGGAGARHTLHVTFEI